MVSLSILESNDVYEHTLKENLFRQKNNEFILDIIGQR